MKPPILLAVPNVSEARDPQVIEAVGQALADGGVRLLDVHSDHDHHRSVFTLAGRSGQLADALLAGAAAALVRIDVMGGAARGAACAEAVVVADRIGEELEVPVFLYGELTGGDGRPPRTRAELRGGGVA